MAGTVEGARKSVKTTYEKYGSDFYEYIGEKGGKAPKTRPSGFAAIPKFKHLEISSKGGRNSRGKSRKTDPEDVDVMYDDWNEEWTT